MGVVCKIAGHKWDGCTCVRCGEHRDEGHDYVAQSGACVAVCSRCGKQTNVHDWQGHPCDLRCSRCGIEAPHYVNASHKWDGCICRVCGKPTKPLIGEYRGPHAWDGCVCSRCGKTRDEGHDWRGCVCARCGKKRDEGHVLVETAVSNGPRGHYRDCSICGKPKLEPHRGELLPGCRCRCVACGYETVWHEFRNGACLRCGIDEDTYYCDRILSGEIGCTDTEYSPVDGSTCRYIRHVNGAAALRRIALADNGRVNSQDKLSCALKLRDIAETDGPEAHEANQALRDLVLADCLGWDTPLVAGWITEPDLAHDPRVIEVVNRVQKAKIDYDNAMIAADSGLGRSG